MSETTNTAINYISNFFGFIWDHTRSLFLPFFALFSRLNGARVILMPVLNEETIKDFD